MNIIKRSGEEVQYNSTKIITAISKANERVDKQYRMSNLQIRVIEEKVRQTLETYNHTPGIEEIQDLVIEHIMRQQAYKIAQIYTEYRYKQALRRQKNTTDDSILALVSYKNEELRYENANKNPIRASTQRDYIAGEVSKDLTNRVLLPEDIVEAHRSGIIHFHDSDYYLMRIINCCLLNLYDMLNYGTVITDTRIDPPQSFDTAANITSQIIAQIASSQYGGQTFNLGHLAPFVNISREKYIRKVIEEGRRNNINYTEQQIRDIAESRVMDEIRSGIQKIQYQLLTIMTTNGQTPFVSMYICLSEMKTPELQRDLALLTEEVFNQRIKGIKNKVGEWVTPAFPKILFILDETNMFPDSDYYYLRELAAKCSAKRMVPDYISKKKLLELKGDVYGCMGCRAWLTPDRFTDMGIGNIANANGYQETEHKYWGRFNQGVVTLNLVDLACSSHRDMDLFWKLLDERLELCHRALRCRHERLLGTPAAVAPILFCHGAIARLAEEQTIDELLYHGYSTISLGFAGLYEMCVYMTGKSHTDPEAKPFAIRVMERLNDACAKWKAEEDIDYSVYSTPLESTTYRFAKLLQEKFGIIKDVTDHPYITNSYHINVREPIDAFSKLKFEAEFQALSPGGAISYVEVPNLQDNITAVMAIQDCIYDNTLYAEINTKSDYCQKCGYDGEIKVLQDEHGKYIWQCPNCGNTDQSSMNVARRTCGYIGVQYWNQGRTAEIADRVCHL